jgi:hypothetical protein
MGVCYKKPLTINTLMLHLAIITDMTAIPLLNPHHKMGPELMGKMGCLLIVKN